MRTFRVSIVWPFNDGVLHNKAFAMRSYTTARVVIFAYISSVVIVGQLIEFRNLDLVWCSLWNPIWALTFHFIHQTLISDLKNYTMSLSKSSKHVQVLWGYPNHSKTCTNYRCGTPTDFTACSFMHGWLYKSVSRSRNRNVLKRMAIFRTWVTTKRIVVYLDASGLIITGQFLEFNCHIRMILFFKSIIRL